MLLQVAMRLFVEHHQLLNHSPNTIEFYKYFLLQLDAFLLIKEIESITLTMLREWCSSLAHRNLKATTRHDAATAIKVFFHWCVTEQLITDNPAERLELPRNPKRMPDVLTTPEIVTLINDAQRNSKQPQRDIALICFWSETGCRISEVADVKVTDVHVTEGYAVVVGKGNKQRWVFFGEATQQSLAEWLTVRPTNRSSLFGLTKSGLEQVIKRLARRTGLKVNPHKLRRSCATLRAARGMTAPALQEAFGWERIETANLYVIAAATMQQAQASHPLDGVNIRSTTD